MSLFDPISVHDAISNPYATQITDSIFFNEKGYIWPTFRNILAILTLCLFKKKSLNLSGSLLFLQFSPILYVDITIRTVLRPVRQTSAEAGFLNTILELFSS